MNLISLKNYLYIINKDFTVFGHFSNIKSKLLNKNGMLEVKENKILCFYIK